MAQAIKESVMYKFQFLKKFTAKVRQYEKKGSPCTLDSLMQLTRVLTRKPDPNLSSMLCCPYVLPINLIDCFIFSLLPLLGM